MKKENTTMEAKIYTCPICGNEYEELNAYAQCILACEAKKKKEEEERKKAQRALEQESRKKALDEAGEYYRKLLTEYIKDYGTYEVKRTAEEIPAAFGKLFDFFNW